MRCTRNCGVQRLIHLIQKGSVHNLSHFLFSLSKIIAKTFLNRSRKRPNACDQTHHEVSSLHPPIVQLLPVQLQQPYHLQSSLFSCSPQLLPHRTHSSFLRFLFRGLEIVVLLSPPSNACNLTSRI